MRKQYLPLPQTTLPLISFMLPLVCWAGLLNAEGNPATTPQVVEAVTISPQEVALRAEMDAQRLIEEREHQLENTLRNIEMVNLNGGVTMGKYEVTQAQWQAVMDDNPARFSACGADCPVENVSWNEIQTFLTQLNAKTGNRYRLATEQEWLSACRAGNTSAYCGANDINSVAWYASNANDKTHPVGQKTPNAWGLYDMSGNVSEWTKTCHDNSCTERVICGGSWINSASVVNLTARDWLRAPLRNSRLGLRLVLDR